MPEEEEGQDQGPDLEEKDTGEEEQPPEPKGEEGKEGTAKGGKPPEEEEELTPEQIASLRKDAEAYKALLPEFTKKSQRLAEFEKGPQKGAEQPQPKEEPFYHKKGWVPESYEELQKAIMHAEQAGEMRALEALKRIEGERETAKTQVDEFVKIVKEKDSEFDEDDFFEFADRHQFPIKGIESLYSVYSAYLEVRGAGTEGAKRAKENILKRGRDTVSKPGGGKGSPYSMPYSKIRGHGSAFDAVREALDQNKQ